MTIQEQVIEEALIDVAAKEAQERGGTLKVLEDITKELEGLKPGEAQMQVLSTDEPLEMWNRHTGRMSKILPAQLRFQLGKKFPAHHPLAGQRVYSLKPVDTPEVAGLKCWLNPDHEMRPWLNTLGLAEKTCQRGKLPTDYAVAVHMQRKHTMAYNIILDERRKKREKKQTDLQQQQLEALQRISSTQESTQVEGAFYCQVEGCARFFDSEMGREKHERSHKED